MNDLCLSCRSDHSEWLKWEEIFHHTLWMQRDDLAALATELEREAA